MRAIKTRALKLWSVLTAAKNAHFDLRIMMYIWVPSFSVLNEKIWMSSFS